MTLGTDAGPRETAPATVIPAGARAPALAVWLVWAATLGSILLFIGRDGRNVPFEEDWLMVAAVTGHEPDLPRWAWSQNSEHRLPLPRLVNLALLRSTGDLRGTMIFDTLAVGAVAAAMILVARRMRGGRTVLADAFFPLLLLHLGNWDNLVWAWQIQFVLPTVLACCLLLVIIAQPTLATPGAATVAGTALIGLPLSGANGLVFAPTLGAWVGYVVRAGRRGRSRETSAAAWLWLAAIATAVLCVVYFIGYEASPWNAPSPGTLATLATEGKFLALSLGPVAEKNWWLFGAIACGVYAVALSILLAARPRREDERLRRFGLLGFLAAALLLAAAIGWGRAGRTAGTGYMPTRYVLLAAPGWCAVYFAALLFARPPLRPGITGGMAALALLLFPLNTRAGLERRDWFVAGFAAFERDLEADAPDSVLAQRHYPFLLHWDESLMRTGLRQLHQAGVGRFRSWDPDPPAIPAGPR